MQIPIGEIHPSPENDQVYRPVDASDPQIVALADSIRSDPRGIREPLIVSADGYIVSGHRRHCAAKLIGLATVPCIRLPIRRDEHTADQWLVVLREHNRQRDKTRGEKLREELVSTNPDDAHAQLWQYRREQAAVRVKPLKIVGTKRRAAISKAKAPFLAAVQAVIEARREFWPLSDRQVHYGLLNAPPLIHARKPTLTYANNLRSYKALTDLLTRARLAGRIAFEGIADETRPVSLWPVFGDMRGFVRSELARMFNGYWRDLMQSQANHIELLGEKNTIASILDPIAREYTIPLTIGRGYSSLPPRHAMAERFKASGKAKLVLLVVSDFDPEGDNIPHSFARSLRDDFAVDAVHAIKVALTAEQVAAHKLPPMMKAKAKSSRRKKFVERHGENVFELEALEPTALQKIVRRAIESVIDRAATGAEIEAEKRDAHFHAGLRRTVRDCLAEALPDLEGGGDE